jgi:hypothetical protein
VFTIWLVVMTYLMHTGIKRQALEPPPAGAATEPERQTVLA